MAFSRRKRKLLIVGVAIWGLFCILWTVYEFWLKTIHPVVPGTIYRSAQLSPRILKHYIKTRNIKTVINLRGPHPDREWYRDELRITHDTNVHHYNVLLTSYEMPSKEQLRQIITLLETAPKPILVHCLGGSDRTGLVSAMATILYNDKYQGNNSLAKAERQFSIVHLVTASHSIGKLVFQCYRKWLQANHLNHSKKTFLKWIYLNDTCSLNTGTVSLNKIVVPTSFLIKKRAIILG